jgi:hypothetical protein
MKKITLLIALMMVSLGFAQPTTSATTPTKLAVDVKSVFSDAYTNISTVELFPNWGQGTLYTNYVIPASSPANNVIKYSNLDYQGINITVAGNPPGVDFSAMTTLHIDVWTPDVASFKLFPIDDKTDALFKTLTPTQAGWNSYDIVLATDFPTLNKASIRQFKFEKTAFKYKAEVNTIYFDNIYFWRAPLAAGTPTISFVIPSKLSSDAPFSLSSLVSSDSSGAFTFTSSNTSVATISGSTLTIVGAGTAVITATQAASGSFIAGSKTADLVVVGAPMTAAPTPPIRNAVDVISLFSNAYTNKTIENWSAPYDDSSIADVQVAGNDTKKITFTNFLGVQFTTPANRIDVTPMEKLHIDLWTATPTLDKVFNLKLSNWAGGAGEANAIQLNVNNGSTPKLPNPNPGTWISLDIDLKNLTAFRNDIAEFIITSGGPGSLGTVYVDNIYFWREPLPAGTPTISFTIPAKVIGEAPFSLTTPIITSDSPGSFAYSSSNTAVATVSGSTVTIVGIGSTTITAVQAAVSGSFNSGSKTATLDVYPTAAPVPQVSPASVIGLYGETYNVDGYLEGFGGVTAADLDPTAGVDNALKINFANAGYGQGFATKDVSAMQYVNFDYYTTDATTFNLHLMSGTAPYLEVIRTVPGIVQNQWVSVNMPISNFNGFNPAQFQQFLFNTQGTGSGTVYIDNLYFSLTDPALGTEKFQTSNVKMYPNPVKNTLTIEANSTIDKIAVYSILGQEVMSKSPNSNATTLQTSNLQKGTYIVKSTIDGKTATSKFIKE